MPISLIIVYAGLMLLYAAVVALSFFFLILKPKSGTWRSFLLRLIAFLLISGWPIMMVWSLILSAEEDRQSI